MTNYNRKLCFSVSVSVSIFLYLRLSILLTNVDCRLSVVILASALCNFTTYLFTRFAIVSKLYRGSYMSAHVLFNLLNELGKRDKMRGLPSILSLFRNEFNKFNNT